MVSNKDFSERRDGKSSKEEPYRTEYEIDKARIIHSEAFRRLQAKTQVLQVSESDFHRNRLTHSTEVAQIGKGISRFIEYKFHDLLSKNNIHINHDLIESICLAHDIGHPPFGHGGEIALNYMMRNHGGFEGNGQTLRIISRLGKYSEGFGMNLTRRTCLGVLKYPCSYSALLNTAQPRNEVTKFHDLNQQEWEPPKSYFDCENEIVDWILFPFSQKDRDSFKSIETVEKKNSKAEHKSFDCSIMDIADDISYAVHDFEDGFELKMFDEEPVNNLLKILFENDHYRDYLKNYKQYDPKKIEELKSLKNPKWFISLSINYLIMNTEIVKENGFESPYLAYRVKLNSESQHILDAFKKIVWDNIIMSPHSQQLVKNGQIIISHLFDVFENNHQILPLNTQKKILSEPSPQRVICDYISGMTDRYALKMYEKLFGSEVISFFEK